jgi:hypothetical protein
LKLLAIQLFHLLKHASRPSQVSIKNEVAVTLVLPLWSAKVTIQLLSQKRQKKYLVRKLRGLDAEQLYK